MNLPPTLHRLAASAGLVLAIGLGACGGDEPSSNGAAGNGATEAQATDRVPIEDYAFKPAAIKVKVGTEVTWTNKDGFDHSVKADDESFGGPDMAKDVTFTHRFDRAGTFTYFCGVHNYMKGSVVVE